MTEDAKPLDAQAITQLEGLAALASLVARDLREQGICLLFINRDGCIERVPKNEIPLDRLEPVDAVRTLLAQGYQDEALELYLRGREDRLGPQCGPMDHKPAETP